MLNSNDTVGPGSIAPALLFTNCLEELFSETQRGVGIREAEILHPGFSTVGFSTVGFGGRRDETPAT